MSYFPIFGNPKPQFYVGGIAAVGYRLFFYSAGTSTKLNTQTDSTGTVNNTNPIVLDAEGYATGNVMIYGLSNSSYKVVMAPPGSDDPPTSPTWTIDNITVGSGADNEWLNPLTATQTSSTTFTVIGDYSSYNTEPGKRIKTTGGITHYSKLVSAVYSSPNTTFTVTQTTTAAGAVDTLDASLDTVYFSILANDSTSANSNFYDIQSWETAANLYDLSQPHLSTLRYIPINLHSAIIDGTGTTDLATYLNNLFTDANTFQTSVSAYTNVNQKHGNQVNWYPGNYYVASQVSIPSRCDINGNNAAIFSDLAINLFYSYGWETTIRNMRFYKGAKAIYDHSGNVDQDTFTLENCYFDGQTDTCIDLPGKNSTKFMMRDCKFKVACTILNSECDETEIVGGWMTVSGAVGTSYIKHTGNLIWRDTLCVPLGQDNTSHWIETSNSTDKAGNIYCTGIRFGGESVMSYIKSYAAANSTANGIERTIKFDKNELWSTGYFDLLEIPNILILKDNHVAVSNTITINCASASAPTSAYMEGIFIENTRCTWDTATNQYMIGYPSSDGNAINQVSTNGYFSGFALSQSLGTGGSYATATDTYPTNNVRSITVGTGTSLYFSEALASSGLVGIYTVHVLVQSDMDCNVKIVAGATQRVFPVYGNSSLKKVSLTGIFYSGADGIGFSMYNLPNSANILFGHPVILKGNTFPNEIVQCPNATTSTVTLIGGKPYVSAVPTDGYWYKGTILYNIAKSVDANSMVIDHWLCTTSGTTFVAQYISTASPAV